MRLRRGRAMIVVTDGGLVIGESNEVRRLVFILSIRLDSGFLLRWLLIWSPQSIVSDRRISGGKTRRVIRWRRDVVGNQAIGMYPTRRRNIFGTSGVIRRTDDGPLDFTIISLIVVNTLKETKPSQGNCRNLDRERTHPRPQERDEESV
jgi:hypothetical protein